LLRADLQQRYPLTIVWTHSYLALEMTKLAADLGIGERLRFLEHVSNEDLATLYIAAAAFVFPSLYEGFGLPVLEAMSCGTPIVAANNSSIPEICGDAAMLVAAEDRDAIAAALTQLLTNSTLQEKLAARGHQRAAGFSWESCARETRALYTAIVSANCSSRSSSFG
jgi:glycosyltransferase involved in cell wall biosynthesis